MLCEWEGPRPPEVRLLLDDVRAALAVLIFLRYADREDSPSGPQEEEEGGNRKRGGQRRGGGQAGPALRIYFFPSSSLCSSFIPPFGRLGGGVLLGFFLSVVLWSFCFPLARRRPYFGWLCWSAVEDIVT